MDNDQKYSYTPGVPLEDDELDQVNGGASSGSVNPETRYTEFFNAWDVLGFPSHGFSEQNKRGMCDEWEEEGFPGTAQQWLSKYKTW